MIKFNNTTLVVNNNFLHYKYILPPRTIRCQFSAGYTPAIASASCVCVDAKNNIWDITSYSESWYTLFYNKSALLKVLDANATGVTHTSYMFYGCTNLAEVPLFDTSTVTTMKGMFTGCYALTEVPLFDTSNVTDMQGMFSNCSNLKKIPLFNTSKAVNVKYIFIECVNVESGLLALYQQMISQTNPPTEYSEAFYHCGINTVNGAAELVQIPSDWK